MDSGQYMSSLSMILTDPEMSGFYECRASYNGKNVVAKTLVLVEGNDFVLAFHQGIQFDVSQFVATTPSSVAMASAFREDGCVMDALTAATSAMN